jgi:dipeptidase E
MRKILLASIALYTIEIFLEKINLIPKESKVAFIPTASNVYPDFSPIEDRAKLVELGFSVKDVNLEGKNKEELFHELKDIDLIFVAGGNTFYLLQEVYKSKFDEVIIELINKGIPYVGSSAGTLILCPSIEIALDIDNQSQAPELKTYDGINLVDFLAIPHCDDEWFNEKIELNLQKQKENKYEVKKMCDNQAIMVIDDKYEMVKHDNT